MGIRLLELAEDVNPGGVDPRTTGLAYIQAQYFEVLCSIPISIAALSTDWMGADKAFLLTEAQMQTGVAHLRGIGWRMQHQQHSGQRRLVGDELPQLGG